MRKLTLRLLIICMTATSITPNLLSEPPQEVPAPPTTDAPPKTTTPSAVTIKKDSKIPYPEVSIMKNALVKAIGTDRIFVLGEGLEDLEFNYTILLLTEDTIVPETLCVGDVVDVKHSQVVTASLPPQTVAFEIKPSEAPVFPELSFIESATITAINLDTQQVTVLPTGEANTPENLITLNVSPDTVIRHEMTKQLYTLSDLKVDMQISAKHSPMMTFSIPPQTPVYEITVLKDNV